MTFLGKISFLFFSLTLCLGFSQEVRFDFKAFGYMPNEVHPTWYEKLNKTLSVDDRLKYLDTIAGIFLKSGYADSLIHYGGELKQTKAYGRPNDTELDSFVIKADYYIGIGYQKMGLMDEAISSFINGIEKSDTNTNFKSRFNIQLAQTYILKKQFEKAKIILDELAQMQFNEKTHLEYLIVKAHYYTVTNELDTAKSIIKKELSAPYINNYDKIKLEFKLRLSSVKILAKSLKEAISICSSIKDIALEKGYYDLYINASLNEGLAYMLSKEYQIAELSLSSVYANTLQWNRLELRQKVISALARLYSAKEDYKNAYSLITQSQAVGNEILSKQNQRLIRDLEFKYETLKKEEEIDELQKDQLVKQAEIKRQTTIKYAFLIGFIIILIPITLLLVVYYQKLQTQSLLNAQQKEIREQELKSLMQTQELTLAKNTISVQQKERNRIARELHDSIGGNLAGIKLKMNSLGDKHPNFKTILNQLDITYEQVREISHSLIPKMFEDSNFTELIKNYLQNFDEDKSVKLRFDTYPDKAINDIDKPLKVTLFNCIKELVTNAFKHAKASEIEIQLTYFSEEKSIELIYEDDGLGFDVNEPQNGIGLKNLKSRVKEFNGTFSVNSAINKGTVITISIPDN